MSKVAYDVKVYLKSEHKAKWVSVGTAFEVNDKGRKQINLILDTLPALQAQWDGTLVLFMKEFKE